LGPGARVEIKELDNATDAARKRERTGRGKAQERGES
jgi:hypothetical protein